MGYLVIAGGVIAALGYIWMIVTGFREHWTWGAGIAVFPLISPVFVINHYRTGIAPFNVMVAGVVLILSPALFTRLVPVDLGPHENVVNGELHLTLTGWDRDDYSVIARKPDTIILQMANEDVTDETLKSLRGLNNLRELDLSFTKITDGGLAVLSDLPELQTLRLQDVAITDAGFKASIMDHPKLERLVLVGTDVSSELVQEWMAANPQRMAMQ